MELKSASHNNAKKRNVRSDFLTVLGVPRFWNLFYGNELQCQKIIEWEWPGRLPSVALSAETVHPELRGKKAANSISTPVDDKPLLRCAPMRDHA